MLPWLAHGHISPFLELAKKLAQRNFTIFFCSTPIIVNPLRETTDPSINFIDLHLPHSPELPPHYHTTKNLPSHLIPQLITASNAGKPSFVQHLDTLKPGLIVYDALQSWALATAHEQGIPACLFLTTAGAVCSFFSHLGISSNTSYPFPALNFPCLDWKAEARGLINIISSSDLILIKTSRELEGKYIDHFSELIKKPLAVTGPLVQEQQTRTTGPPEIMDWLSQKEPASVVLISFGSECFLSTEELSEIARGLEFSNIEFIWIIRFHPDDRHTSVDEALPVGFLQRTQNRGLVFENWAPQAEILRHSSIGGFMSHCGWNSTLEAIMAGVPIIAMPMRMDTDQPMNAKLAVEIGVAIEVFKKDGKFRKEAVDWTIRETMVEKQGKEVRKKANELMKKMKQKGDEEIDEAMEMIGEITGLHIQMV